MKRAMEKLEGLLEIGGIRKDIVLLAISGIAVLCSLLKIQPLPFDMAWVTISPSTRRISRWWTTRSRSCRIWWPSPSG